MSDLRAPAVAARINISRAESVICADGCVVGVTIFGRGCGFTVWSDTHLTYMINIALTAEFSLAAEGVR